MPPTRLVITMQLLTADSKPPLRRWLVPALRRLAALADAPRGRIALVIVDDKHMSELHQRHTGIAGTTDVLTFDLREDKSEISLDGDIVICLDEAKRQAQKRGRDARLEILLYALHGLLHLQGHDDHRPADYRRMHAREDELLTRAGFGPLFADQRK